MFVIQATWQNNQLLLWAESTRKTVKHENNMHPLSATSEELRQALSHFEIEHANQTIITAYLPSDDLGPVPSPRLYMDRTPSDNNDIHLQAWTIEATSLEPVNALIFLTSIPQELPHGIKLDDSVYFWLEATKLLLELLTRGRFIPSVALQNSNYRSQWTIVPRIEEDTNRIQILSEGMPIICRSVINNNEKYLLDPNKLLDAFISTAGDCLIRHFLTNRPLINANSTAVNHLNLSSNWLRSLTNIEGYMDGPIYELAKFEHLFRRWTKPVINTQSQQIKTCFKLNAPLDAQNDNVTDNWDITFYIQSAIDHNLLLKVADFWNGEMGFLASAEHTREEIEESLLTDLGRASHVFPQIRASLHNAYPTNIKLNTNEAYVFLKETAPLLEQSGHGVIYPKWWKQTPFRIGLNMNIKSEPDHLLTNSRPDLIGLNSLAQFSWNVSLGDETLSLEEFKKLVDAKSPLIRHEGEWIALSSKDIESTIAFLEKHKDQSKIKLIDALRIGLGAQSDSVGLPILGFNAEGWINKLLSRDIHELPKVRQPTSFKGSLRPYQLDGLSWLSFLDQVNCGACLADDMGLGKTIQLLALLLLEREQAKSKKLYPTLLIAPMSILENWQQEATHFAPKLNTFVHHGSTRGTGQSFINSAKEADLVITTYSLAYRDESLLSNIPWERIVLDEAQNIKNLGTKQSQAIRRLALKSKSDKCEETGCKRIVLTGTPLENRLDELWSVLDFINPGYLGSLNEFRSKFAVPIERYKNAEAAEKLSKLVRPFILRRVKTDKTVIDDLPEKMEIEIKTNITPEQAALYQSILNKMLPQVDASEGIHRKGLVLSTITKLKQICNHPTLFLKDDSPLADRSGKLNRLEELLEVILSEGDRVLIFTQYAQMGHLLKPYLQDRFGQEVLFLHGSLTKSSRDNLVTRFQSASGPAIFILSLKAGGYGLNLTAANQIIHYDQWWNPAVEDQATDRAFRIGQKRNVQVRKFICTGTLEEKISTLLEHKKDLADTIVSSTKRMMTELSTEELRHILELSKNEFEL
jgi:SNF2 family DNA or RNA helicase